MLILKKKGKTQLKINSYLSADVASIFEVQFNIPCNFVNILIYKNILRLLIIKNYVKKFKIKPVLSKLLKIIKIPDINGLFLFDI